MEKKEKREKEKRALVPSPQIIMMICKSILIFLHHTFHKHMRHISIVLSDHLAEFGPPYTKSWIRPCLQCTSIGKYVHWACATR